MMLKNLFNHKLGKDKSLGQNNMLHNMQAISLILIPSLVCLLLNCSYYVTIFPHFGFAKMILLIGLHISFGCSIFAFTLCGRYFYIIFCFLILTISCIVSYYKKVYSSHLTTEIIDFILHSDAQGIRDHLDIQIFLWVGIFVVIPTLLMIKISQGLIITIKAWLSRWIIFPYLMMILCFCASNTKVSMTYYLGSIGYIVPYNYLMVIEEYFSQYNNKSQTEKFNNFSYEKHNHKNIVTVLFIGESARYDHFSINGYKRATSPHLEQIKNLISFSNAYSLETYTSVGVPRMLRNNDLQNHVSLIKLMEFSGFKTYWISNHRKHGDLVTDVALEAQHTKFRDDIHSSGAAHKFDSALLDQIDEILALNNSQNLFIVLHAIGSHLNYDLRYPAEYAVYRPTCKRNYTFFGRDSCTEIENLTNSYDNSILYSDYIISQIIAKLSSRNAFLLFASDHGQSLGENGIYFHGAEYATAPDEQTHIAMFAWASNQFLKDPKHSQFFKSAAQKKDSKITHANIFHSIPHCIGLKKNIDLNMSICK